MSTYDERLRAMHVCLSCGSNTPPDQFVEVCKPSDANKYKKEYGSVDQPACVICRGCASKNAHRTQKQDAAGNFGCKICPFTVSRLKGWLEDMGRQLPRGAMNRDDRVANNRFPMVSTGMQGAYHVYAWEQCRDAVENSMETLQKQYQDAVNQQQKMAHKLLCQGGAQRKRTPEQMQALRNGLIAQCTDDSADKALDDPANAAPGDDPDKAPGGAFDEALDDPANAAPADDPDKAPGGAFDEALDDPANAAPKDDAVDHEQLFGDDSDAFGDSVTGGENGGTVASEKQAAATVECEVAVPFPMSASSQRGSEEDSDDDLTLAQLAHIGDAGDATVRGKAAAVGTCPNEPVSTPGADTSPMAVDGGDSTVRGEAAAVGIRSSEPVSTSGADTSPMDVDAGDSTVRGEAAAVGTRPSEPVNTPVHPPTMHVDINDVTVVGREKDATTDSRESTSIPVAVVVSPVVAAAVPAVVAPVVPVAPAVKSRNSNKRKSNVEDSVIQPAARKPASTLNKKQRKQPLLSNKTKGDNMYEEALEDQARSYIAPTGKKREFYKFLKRHGFKKVGDTSKKYVEVVKKWIYEESLKKDREHERKRDNEDKIKQYDILVDKVKELGNDVDRHRQVAVDAEDKLRLAVESMQQLVSFCKGLGVYDDHVASLVDGKKTANDILPLYTQVTKNDDEEYYGGW